MSPRQGGYRESTTVSCEGDRPFYARGDGRGGWFNPGAGRVPYGGGGAPRGPRLRARGHCAARQPGARGMAPSCIRREPVSAVCRAWLGGRASVLVCWQPCVGRVGSDVLPAQRKAPPVVPRSWGRVNRDSDEAIESGRGIAGSGGCGVGDESGALVEGNTGGPGARSGAAEGSAGAITSGRSREPGATWLRGGGV